MVLCLPTVRGSYLRHAELLPSLAEQFYEPQDQQRSGPCEERAAHSFYGVFAGEPCKGSEHTNFFVHPNRAFANIMVASDYVLPCPSNIELGLT